MPLGLAAIAAASLAAAPFLVGKRPRRGGRHWPGQWYSRADALGADLDRGTVRSLPSELLVATAETVQVLDFIADRFEAAILKAEGDDVEVEAPQVIFWAEPGIAEEGGPAAEMACTGYRVVIQAADAAEADKFVVLLQGIGDELPLLLAQSWGDRVVLVRHPHGVTGACTWVTSESWDVDDNPSEPTDPTEEVEVTDEVQTEEGPEEAPEEAPVVLPEESPAELNDGKSWTVLPEA